MDFGSILDKWEKNSSPPGKGNGGASLVYPGSDREKDYPAHSGALHRGSDQRGSRRSRLLRKKPDASIDLHGLSRDEAWQALEVFFLENSRCGSEKLLIIHGKGNHGSESVLKEMVRQFIECSAIAGESGHNPARGGGTGATWVILKGS